MVKQSDSQNAASAQAKTEALGHLRPSQRQACHRCLGQSPNVIIDAAGLEVGVVIDYSQFVSLLGILATQVDCHVLPPYWRMAVETCLVLGNSSPVGASRAAQR